MCYLLLNETEGNECFYFIGCFENLDDAVNAVDSIDPSRVDHIDEELTVNVLEINGMKTYEGAETVYSATFRKKYNEETDEYEWRKVGDNVELKPLPELFKHGVSVYGFEAEKKMWEFKGAGGDWQDLPGHADYYAVVRGMKKGFYDHRRKTSASLPFDLDRAVAGDVVECSNTETDFKQITTNDLQSIIKKGWLELYVENGFLRMKYPPKLENKK
jgi:hypothetical protein